MKLYHYIMYRLIRGLVCLWSLLLLNCYCGDGKPFSEDTNAVPASLQKYFVDCGSLQQTAAATKSINPGDYVFYGNGVRQGSFVSSVIRRMDQDYTTAYTCFRAFKVDEMPTCLEGSVQMEGSIQYIVNKSTLDKVTSAKLTISLAFPNNVGDEDYKQLRNLEVKGLVSGYKEHEYFSIPRLEEDADGTRKQHMVNFNASALLQTASEYHARDKVGNIHDKAGIFFFIKRNCDELKMPHCPNIFDTETHTPSLRLFYI